jgi:hypothetical protein
MKKGPVPRPVIRKAPRSKSITFRYNFVRQLPCNEVRVRDGLRVPRSSLLATLCQFGQAPHGRNSTQFSTRPMLLKSRSCVGAAPDDVEAGRPRFPGSERCRAARRGRGKIPSGKGADCKSRRTRYRFESYFPDHAFRHDGRPKTGPNSEIQGE